MVGETVIKTCKVINHRWGDEVVRELMNGLIRECYVAGHSPPVPL